MTYDPKLQEEKDREIVRKFADEYIVEVIGKVERSRNLYKYFRDFIRKQPGNWTHIGLIRFTDKLLEVTKKERVGKGLVGGIGIKLSRLDRTD